MEHARKNWRIKMARESFKKGERQVYQGGRESRCYCADQGKRLKTFTAVESGKAQKETRGRLSGEEKTKPMGIGRTKKKENGGFPLSRLRS